ncbi:MAG: hypothetical protein ACRDVW_12210 [Acidimicrobiales bacterium]
MRRIARLNRGQQVVVVIGLALSLDLLGLWLTTIGQRIALGWVAYAPLSDPQGPGGMSLGWRLLIWAALVVIWTAVSVVILHSRPSQG